MYQHRFNLLIILLLLIFIDPHPHFLLAQTKNPDISIITDFRTFIHNDKSRSVTKGKLNLELQEMELAIQGYLNPYARADIYFAKHGIEGEIEIEEAYATFLRGLPWGLNIKAGKYQIRESYLTTIYEATRIGKDIYIDMREQPYIIRRDDDAYSILYNTTGLLLNTVDGIRLSLQEKLQDLNELYNIELSKFPEKIDKTKRDGKI